MPSMRPGPPPPSSSGQQITATPKSPTTEARIAEGAIFSLSSTAASQSEISGAKNEMPMAWASGSSVRLWKNSTAIAATMTPRSRWTRSALGSGQPVRPDSHSGSVAAVLITARQTIAE